jgi:hypothetical protein
VRCAGTIHEQVFAVPKRDVAIEIGECIDSSNAAGVAGQDICTQMHGDPARSHLNLELDRGLLIHRMGEDPVG